VVRGVFIVLGGVVVDFDLVMDYLVPLLERVLPSGWSFDRTVLNSCGFHFRVYDALGGEWLVFFEDLELGCESATVDSLAFVVGRIRDFSDMSKFLRSLEEVDVSKCLNAPEEVGDV
jgi:hypothetical protein